MQNKPANQLLKIYLNLDVLICLNHMQSINVIIIVGILNIYRKLLPVSFHLGISNHPFLKHNGAELVSVPSSDKLKTSSSLFVDQPYSTLATSPIQQNRPSFMNLVIGGTLTVGLIPRASSNIKFRRLI